MIAPTIAKAYATPAVTVNAGINMDRPPDIAKPKPAPPMIAFTNVVTLKFIYPPYPDDLQRPLFLQANEIRWFTILIYASEVTKKVHRLFSICSTNFDVNITMLLKCYLDSINHIRIVLAHHHLYGGAEYSMRCLL